MLINIRVTQNWKSQIKKRKGWPPREDSNPYLSLRRALFYPVELRGGNGVDSTLSFGQGHHSKRKKSGFTDTILSGVIAFATALIVNGILLVLAANNAQ